ncbi:MAG: hypothetical protein V4590_06460 [Bacteroidota bacterium]
MKPEQPFEKREHGLTGYASLDFHLKEDFNVFAANITEYNPDRFDPVALKIMASESTLIVTLFALDKSAREKSSYPDDKLPVKKFKMEMEYQQFMSLIKHFDLIVSNETYPIADIVVINK